MQIRIRTLTPIWSGDVNGKCTKLRETAIIGSLRWWFEAIVRGLGGYACDPTSNEKCEYKDNTNDICAVCELFGTTGWAKRFKFEIKQSFHEIYESNLVIIGSIGSWYYPSGLVSCNDKLNEIKQILQFDKNIESIFRALFTFISNWGMIGGKTAIGYGAVRFEDENGNPIKSNNKDIKTFFEYLEEKKNHGKNAVNAPRLDEMFFAKFKIKEECIDKIIKKVEENIRVKNSEKMFPKLIFKCNGVKEEVNTAKEFLQRLKDCHGFIPTSALVRKGLRIKIKNEWKDNDKLRHFLMGELGRFSAIQISHIYWNGKNWEFRIWGWVPKNLDGKFGVTRNNIVESIKNTLNEKEFWNSAFGNFCFLEKLNGDSIVTEYPNTNWNFIDFGKLSNAEIKKAFAKIIGLGDKNDV